MESADRLASYLAGDLSPTEAAAVEALVARDPGLAADLRAMRRADDALSQVSSLEPDEGFESRLRDVVDRELARTLRPHGVVELPARPRRGWTMPLAAAAAAIVGIAGIGLVIGQRTAPDDDVMALTVPDAAEAPAESAEPEMGAMLADPDAHDTAEALRAAPPAAPPTVVVTDRDLTADDLDAALHAPELVAVAEVALPSDDARALAAEWRRHLEVAAPPSPDVVACLDAVGDALPVTVEVARLDGLPVVVFGLVVSDPTGSVHSERQVVVVAADGCALRVTLPAG